MEFQDKRKIKRLIYSKATLVILSILIILLLNAVWKVYGKQSITEVNLSKTASVYSSLKKREEDLSIEIARLKSDSGREAEIREKYGMIKDNEEVIVIVDNKDSDANKTSVESNWWRKIIDWFE